MEEVYKLTEKWVYDDEIISNKIGGTWNVLGEKLKGELTYNKNNGNITLKMYKIINYQEEYFKFINNDERIDYIKGITNNQKDCILKNCEITATKLNNFYLQIFIQADTLFIDYRKKEKKVKFKEIDFRLTNSLIWANANYFEFLNTGDNKIDLVYEPKKHKTIKINNHTWISFIPTKKTDSFVLDKEDIHLVQYVTINIFKSKAVLYDEFMEDIEKVINLIAFATNKNVTIYNLTGYNDNQYITFENEKDYLPIEIVDSKMHREEIDENIFNKKPTPLFDLNDMIKNNNLALWFNKYEEYRNIFNLFLLNIKNEIPLEIQFNNLMQALELIHRIKYKHKNKFVNHIQSKFKNNKNIIENILEHKDQKDCPYIILRSRLIDILNNDFTLFQANYTKENIIILADILTDSRNYYTHYNESKKEKSVKGRNLEYAIVILEYLITALMLQELNFKLEDINEMLEKQANLISRYTMFENICESYKQFLFN